jgi:hypothetical protein
MSAFNTTGFSEDELSMLAFRRARRLAEQERTRRKAAGDASTANTSNSFSAAFTRSILLLLGMFIQVSDCG